MGCSTCNQQNQNQEEKDNISLVSNQLMNSNVTDYFLIKVGTFIAVVLAIPFIVLALVFQVFIHFFIPKSVNGINKRFRNGFTNLFVKLQQFRIKKEIKKREQQFKNNGGYDENSELLDIEVYEDIEDNKKAELN